MSKDKVLGALLLCIGISYFTWLMVQALVFDALDDIVQGAISDETITAMAAANYLHFIFLAITIGVTTTVVIAMTRGASPGVVVVFSGVANIIAFILTWVTSSVVVYAFYPTISASFLLVAPTLLVTYVLRDPFLFYTTYMVVSSIIVVGTNVLAGVFDA